MNDFLNPKVKEIAKTTGKHHFFGYYDICPWDAKDEKILAHEVDFIDRMPTGIEPVGIGYFTEKDGFKKLTDAYEWNFQQGTRLQWLPNDLNKIIYNDREKTSRGERYSSCIVDIRKPDGKKYLGYPIYAVNPDGKFALGLDFAWLHSQGAYGFPYASFGGKYIQKHPKDPLSAGSNQGIMRVDLITGEAELMESLTHDEINNFDNKFKDRPSYIPHILFNPSGTRICFLHRFKLPDGGIHTRLFTANPDGTDLFLLAEGTLSHFDWFSDDEIFIWGRNRQFFTSLRRHNFFKSPLLKPVLNFVRKKERGFLRHRVIGDQLLLFKDKVGYMGSLGVNKITEDGHFTRYKDTDWILGDNYPDKNHFRDLFLFNLKTKEKIILGRFYSLPAKTSAEVSAGWDLSGMRTDLHPRFSHDGKKVCIDSVHEGTRQIHVLDIGNLINEYGKN